MIKPYLFLLSFCFVIPLFGQINGISASKIGSFNARTLDPYVAEFEPNYGITHTKEQWDADGNLIPLYQSRDSVSIASMLAFRVAYSFSHTFEVGAFLSSSSSNWAAKYNFLNKEKYALGLMAGVTLPFGATTVIDRNNLQASQVRSYGLGLIGTIDFNENSSIDMNIQIQDYFSSADGLSQSDRFFSIDYGHYINQQTILLAASLGYQHSSLEVGSQEVVTFSPGISFEMNPRYFIVANGSFSLSGKNSQKSNGFNVAWTITF